MTIETDAGTLTLTRSKYTADRIARAVNLVAEGHSYGAASQDTGIPSGTVEWYVQSLGGQQDVRRGNGTTPVRTSYHHAAPGRREEAMARIDREAEKRGVTYAEAVSRAMAWWTI